MLVTLLNRLRGRCNRETDVARCSVQNPITASVGVRGINRPQDVGIVQFLLNRASAQRGVPKEQIDVDGIFGPETLAALREFQKKYLKTVDGLVEMNGETLKMLHQVAGPLPRANDGVAFLDPEMGPTRIV
jgi:hypothetical protein